MKNKNNNFQLSDFVEALLDDEMTLKIKMQGFSMYPTLKGGDTAFVEKSTAQNVRPGDILVFKQNDKYIAHRLIKIISENERKVFIAKGDNNLHFDNPFYETDLIGKVSSFQKKNSKSATSISAFDIRRTLAVFFPIANTKLNNRILSIKNRFSGFKHDILKLITNFKLTSAGSGKQITINAVISFFQGILPFVLIVCIKSLIDVLTTANSQNFNALFFYGLLIATAIVFLANGISTELRSYFGEKLSQSIVKKMYAKVQHKHLTLHISHFENPKELDKIHRAVQEATYRPVKFINELLTLLKSIASAVFLTGLFLSIKWYLVLILILSVIPGVIVRIKFARKFHRLKDSQSQSERELYYFNRILTGFPFAKELKLFHFNAYFGDKFKRLQKKLFSERINLRKSEVSWNVVSHIFTVLLIFVSFAYIAFLKINGEITIGSVVLFFFAFQRGYSVLSDLFKSGTQILEDAGYINDVQHFFAIEDKNIRNLQTMSLKSEIRIENVSFSYETSKREALKCINLTIPAGKTIAIVGANGSGKSTFIKLLCGFYLPDAGEIFFDNVSTRKLGQHAISKNMAAVFQDFALYNVSAFQNIVLGNIEQEPDIDKVREAAKAAGIHDVLEKLPKGYHTILGNSFNGGEELSMGQWQKMAIARAFYRNAELIVLDEPSSALDVYSETQIIDALRKMTENKTAIIISHRLTSVQWADEIYLFDNGQIVEHGSHADLIALKGRYFKLYQTAKNS